MAFTLWGTQTSKPIQYWNRTQNRLETETVYGEGLVKWFYQTSAGQKLVESVFSKPLVSKLYGLSQDSKLSSRKVPRFIRDFEIPMEEFESGPFYSFNEFFVRRFRPGKRSFVEGSRMAAFAEARYFGWENIRDGQTFPVKGEELSAAGLLGSSERAKPFMGGPLLIARLCPVDYHRFHFPDSGKTLEQYPIAGALHSVNPLALQYRGDIFITNERHASILQTERFGKLAYIEVGALCVGKIIQSHPVDRPFKRGDEKGYFLFGGSTVIVAGEPGAWRPSQDILDQTSQGRETLVRLGDEIAVAL